MRCFYNIFLLVLFYFLSEARFLRSDSLTKETPFSSTDHGFIRDIRYPVTEEYPEFISIFDYDFFTQERERNVTIDNVLDYIQQGVLTFKTSLTGFHKLKTEFLKKTNSSHLNYTEPLYLDNTTHVVNIAQSNLSTTVNLYNLKFYGLVDINATHFGSYSVDAEQVARFHIVGKSYSEVLNICGQHSLQNTEEFRYGSFCFNIVNVTYDVDYGKFRTTTGNIKTTEIKEEINYEYENYTDITFSTESFDRWSELQPIHFQALNSSLLETHLPLISERFRYVYDAHYEQVRAQEGFIQMYRERVLSSMTDLVKLYLKKLNRTLTISEQKQSNITFENVSKFLHHYSHNSLVDDTGLIYDIGSTVYYSETESDTIIEYQSERYIIQSWSIKFRVKLLYDELVDIKDVEVSNVDIEVSNVVIDFEINNSTKIEHSVKDAINSATKVKVLNFIEELVNQKCKADEIKNPNINKL